MAWRPARLRPERDTWVRHGLAARLLDQRSGGGRVLDVGGVAGWLAAHLPSTEVVTVNVAGPADVIFDGRRLPFGDAEFDAVASLDVLEHLPADERRAHVAELVRVAGRVVVACCPAGTPEHVATERELADWYARLSGRRSPFLDEHLACGLPTPDELRALGDGWTGYVPELSFQGDFRASAELFRLEALAVFRRRPVIDRARFAWRRLRTPLDETFRRTASAWDNEAFLRLRRPLARPDGRPDDG
jgi:SAM-dependent methyltransferase